MLSIRVSALNVNTTFSTNLRLLLLNEKLMGIERHITSSFDAMNETVLTSPTIRALPYDISLLNISKPSSENKSSTNEYFPDSIAAITLSILFLNGSDSSAESINNVLPFSLSSDSFSSRLYDNPETAETSALTLLISPFITGPHRTSTSRFTSLSI